MHKDILAKVYLKKGKEGKEDFDYHKMWEEKEKKRQEERDEHKEYLKKLIGEQKNVPAFVKLEIMKMIDGEKDIRQEVLDGIEKYKAEIKKTWPEELISFVFRKVKELK